MSKKDYSKDLLYPKKQKTDGYKINRNYDTNSYDVRKDHSPQTPKSFLYSTLLIVIFSFLIALILGFMFQVKNSSFLGSVSTYNFFIGGIILIFASLSSLYAESPTFQSAGYYMKDFAVNYINPFSMRRRVDDTVDRSKHTGNPKEKQKKEEQRRVLQNSLVLL